MANTILTPDQITRKALAILRNKLVLGRSVNRQYDKSFAVEGAKIGQNLRVRLPNRYKSFSGAKFVAQDENEQFTNIAVTKQRHIGLQFTSAELTLGMDDFADRVLEPAMAQLAADVDADLATVYNLIGQSVGTPGTDPSTSLVMLQAHQKLDEAAAMDDMKRMCVVNPAANVQLVDGMKGLFHPGPALESQFKTGFMANNLLRYREISMSQSIQRFTTGSRTAGATVTTTVSTQGQTTLALTTNGATDTIKAGDVFTIANVYKVNPQTRQSTGALYQFVALADATAVANAVTVTVPAMYDASHALASIDAFPQAAAAVTWMGGASTSYAQNLAFHPDAITLATADLYLPTKGVEFASRAVADGISLRIVKQYDGVNDEEITRADVLYGFAALRPEAACRIWGA